MNIQQLLRQLSGLERLHVLPPLELHQTSSGRWITIDPEPTEFLATLSGSGLFYGWTAVESNLSGTHAYPLNGETNLAGMKVWLRKTEAGDWRFEWNRFGYCHKEYCLLLTSLTTGEPVEGATVELLEWGTLEVLASGTTGADGRWCVMPYPANLGALRITLDTPHGTIASGVFRLVKSGACDILDEYTVCYGQACLTVADGTEGGPLEGATVEFQASCANDPLNNPSFTGNPVVESPPGTYCALLYRIQPKVRGCQGPMSINASAEKDCYHPPTDAAGPARVFDFFNCADWSGSVALKHYPVVAFVAVSAACRYMDATIDVNGSTLDIAYDRFTAPSGTFPRIYYQVPLPWPPDASYTATLTPSTPGYLTPEGQTITPGSFGPNCGPGGMWTFDVLLDPDYACGCCGRPVKKLLHYSDAYGSCTLTWTPGAGLGGSGAWVGSYTFSPASAHHGSFVDGSPVCAPSNGAVTVNILLYCPGEYRDSYGNVIQGPWAVRKTFLYCVAGDGAFLMDGGSGGGPGEVDDIHVFEDCSVNAPLSLNFNLVPRPGDLSVADTGGPGTITE